MKLLFFGATQYDRDSFNKELADFPEVDITYTKTNLTWRTAILAKGYDAVCAFVNANINAMAVEILAGLGVKHILMRCAGFDAVDHAMAKTLGIVVTRVPAYSPEAIAEHAMAIGQTANRRIHKGYIRVRENDFSLDGLVGETLVGKTAGIIGTGRIGAALCKICKGYGMKVIGADLFPNPGLVEQGIVDEYVEIFEDENGNKKVDYDSLYAQADFISLHAFLNKESYHMIGEESIAKMKDGVIFVNTGRGGLVDTMAIIHGVKSGKFGAVGLDVYEEENENVYRNRSGELVDSITARLCSFPNVVVTSHQAFFTKQALAEIARVTLTNAVAKERGEDYVARSQVC